MSERDDLMEQAHETPAQSLSIADTKRYIADRGGLRFGESLSDAMARLAAEEEAPRRVHATRYRVSLWKGRRRASPALAARWESDRVVEALRFVLMWKLPGDTHITIEAIEA